MRLDRDDRAALARLGVYSGIAAGALLALIVALLVAAVCVGFAVHAFFWAGG